MQYLVLDTNQIYLMLIALIMISLVMIKVFFPETFIRLIKLFKKLTNNFRLNKGIQDDDSLNEILTDLGYSYDFMQDIFYSNIDAWQREMGYTRAYDEAAAPMSMIIDCEPIYFDYDSREWLIEFWKGQYGMTTGCEIGIYETKESEVNTEYFKTSFYNCVRDEDMIKMSFVLEKNGKKIMSRKGVHWWLTGFKFGECSHPHELKMNLKITLKDNLMRNEFVNGLKEAGYADDEIVIVNNTVRLVFDEPKTPQPYTRSKITDYIMQANNRNLCEEFNNITMDYDNSIDKINYLKEAAPELLNQLYKFGKNKSIFEYYL